MKTSNGCSITSSRRLRGALVTLLGAILMSGAAVATPPTYRIVLLPELPGTESSHASDISDAGQIVGSANPTSGNGYGISWGATPYAPQPLVSLTPDHSTAAKAVNDAGFVVGNSSLNGRDIAVMWDPSGAIVELGDLPQGPDSSVYDMNAFGVAVGSATNVYQIRPVFWTAPGAIRRLGIEDGKKKSSQGKALALNDFGDIVGYGSVSRDIVRAARWPAGQRRMQDLGDLPGGADYTSRAHAINNAGQVVGYGYSELGRRAILWNNDGSMTDLGAIDGGMYYEAVDINPAGQILGEFFHSGKFQAFLWTAEDGMMDLYDLIDPADPLRAQFGAYDVTISAINASGLIVGLMHTDSDFFNTSAIVLVPQE